MKDTKIGKCELYHKSVGSNEFTKTIVEDFPNGFPRLSCFLDSDDAFMIYRRFGTVISRLLLLKQDEISRMEDILCRMDSLDEANGNQNYLMSYKLDGGRSDALTVFPESRIELLQRIEKKVLEYSRPSFLSDHR